MRRTIPTVLSLAILAAAGAATATIYEVPGDYLTIGEALDAAHGFHDEVHVAPGTYYEHGLSIPDFVTLKGTGDLPRDVTIDAGGQGRVVTSAEWCWIENLRLTGGAAEQGGGLAVIDRTCHLTDVVIDACTANLGAGILVRTGSVEMVRCEVTENVAVTAGGGLYALDAPSVIMRDCAIAWNVGGAYGGAWSAARSSVTMEGCTVVENSVDGWTTNGYLHNAGLGAEGASFDGMGVTITRSISSANTPEDGYEEVESVVVTDRANRIETSCSLRWQDEYPGWPGYLADQLGDPGAQNLESDPLFCLESGELSDYLGIAADSPCLPANTDGCGLIGAFGEACGVTATPDTPKVSFALHPAYPNPFNPQTTVAYAIDRAGPVSLVIYGLDGRRVATLVNEDRAAGAHTVTWAGLDDRGRSVASGVYLCRLVAGTQAAAIRMTLVK